jgi:hypothetical protein
MEPSTRPSGCLVVAGVVTLLGGIIAFMAGTPLYGRCLLSYGVCAPGIGFLLFTGLGGLLGAIGVVMITLGKIEDPARRPAGGLIASGISLMVAAAYFLVLFWPPSLECSAAGDCSVPLFLQLAVAAALLGFLLAGFGLARWRAARPPAEH